MPQFLEVDRAIESVASPAEKIDAKIKPTGIAIAMIASSIEAGTSHCPRNLAKIWLSELALLGRGNSLR